MKESADYERMRAQEATRIETSLLHPAHDVSEERNAIHGVRTRRDSGE